MQTPQSVSSVLSGYVAITKTNKTETIPSTLDIDTQGTLHTPDTSRLGITLDMEPSAAITPTDLQKTPETSQVVVTADHVDELEQVEIKAAEDRTSELHLLLDDTQDNSLVVETDNVTDQR